uniref:hypothetical protein n=1 Tax=Nocardia cyriacigeorgica TaxID=135487 RepID=UPI002455CED6
HCGLDGTTILSFVDTLLESTVAEHAERSGARPQGLPVVEPIEFRLSAPRRALCAPRRRRGPGAPARRCRLPTLAQRMRPTARRAR